MHAVGVTAQWVDGSELWLEGTAADYSALGDALESGWRGTVALDRPPKATGKVLRALLVRETEATHVTFARETSTVAISGSTAALNLLAANLKRLGQLLQPGGGPSHWDYFDGHPLLDVGSAPTVTWLV